MGLFRKTKFRIDDYTKQDIEARLNKPSGWVDKAISDIDSLGEKRDVPQVAASSDTDVRFISFMLPNRMIMSQFIELI